MLSDNAGHLLYSAEATYIYNINDFNDKTTTTMFIHGNSDDDDYEL